MLVKLSRRIRANILVGFFLTVPIVATVLIFHFLFGLATGWLPEAVLPAFQTTWYGKVALRIITLLAILAVLGFIGLLTRNIMGRRMFQLGDAVLQRIPLIKGIYVSVRQISESLFTQRKTLFKEVVMVEYPRQGLHSLAFVTARVPSQVAARLRGRKGNEECVSLFIPTTPNPTSGVLILLPRSQTIPLDLPVSEGLTFIMSAGAVVPGDKGVPAPTLLDKLEAWLRQGDDAETAAVLPAPVALPETPDGSGPDGAGSNEETP
ncbi:MAG: DUF502 domain-containing protein [Anaerolineae bacterium]